MILLVIVNFSFKNLKSASKKPLSAPLFSYFNNLLEMVTTCQMLVSFGLISTFR